MDSVVGEAKEDYDSKQSGMLSFKKGDQIIIMAKNKTGIFFLLYSYHLFFSFLVLC